MSMRTNLWVWEPIYEYENQSIWVWEPIYEYENQSMSMRTNLYEYENQSIWVWEPNYMSMRTKLYEYENQSIWIWEPIYMSMRTNIWEWEPNFSDRKSMCKQDNRRAHAPANGGPVFPGTFLGFVFLLLLFVFNQNFKISTSWRNAQVWGRPVQKHR